MRTLITSKKTLSTINLNGENVLIRVDYNVPIENAAISDNFRITSSIETLKEIISQDPKILYICSHMGRPKGKVVESLSLKIVVPELQSLLEKAGIKKKVYFNEEPLNSISALSSKYEKGSIVLLENLRFYPEEEAKFKGDPEKDKGILNFRSTLTSLCTVFVFDAFACAHRPHSSVSGVEAKERIAGRLMEREFTKLELVSQFAGEGFCVILGGAKVSDKIKLIRNLLNKVSVLIIGGAMANSFVTNLNGLKMGDSLCENGEEAKKICEEIKEECEMRKIKLVLPIDFVLEDCSVLETKVGRWKENLKALDIGPESVKIFIEEIKKCKRVFWNGPMGLFENEKFATGTFEILKELSRSGMDMLVGGGDTASACKKIGIKSENIFVSTGGGACIEYLEGKELPGLVHLSEASKCPCMDK